jgi:predicted AAA+ superfamily ATPase
MIERPFWISRIEEAWKETPIVWLAGVRRAGKTTLVQGFGPDRGHYINCGLPVAADMVADPELFYRNCERPIVIFDEIHRLPDPSRVLKIGADLFPHLKLIATGSSTLAESRKFKDTLTGRKRLIHLTPVLWDELSAFKVSLIRRLHHGGLPQPLLTDTKPMGFYREWIDSFFARDIQQLFAFRDSEKFNTLFEYLLKQSSGQFEITRTSSALGISRPTIADHLRALEITHAVTVVRPFHGEGQKEIIKMPKVYGFDTGFVSFARGWDPLRQDDYGPLWEHIILEYLQAHVYESQIQYWRLADGREIDFVVPRGRDMIDVIECKWNPEQFDPASLKLFRALYPKGNNYIVSPISVPGYPKKISAMDVYICNPTGWHTKYLKSR